MLVHNACISLQNALFQLKFAIPPLDDFPLAPPVNVRMSRRHHADKQRVANQYHARQKSLENPRALGLSLSRF
jgi:hypothetical protein